MFGCEMMGEWDPIGGPVIYVSLLQERKGKAKTYVEEFGKVKG